MSHNEGNNDEMKSTHPSHTHEYVWIGDAINLSLNQAEKDQNLVQGIPSGFPSLDRLTHGWNGGELTVFAARPAIGKTAFSLGIARNAAVDFGVPTLYFSLELPTIALTDRLIVSETGIPMAKLHGKDKLFSEDWSRMEESLRMLSNAPLYFDDTAGLTTEQFRQRVADLSARKGVKLVIVDHFHLVCGGEKETFSNRHQEEEAVMRCLKEAASAFGVSVIVLTYLKRPLRRNYSGPVLTDLYDYCPATEEYADKIILLDRPLLYSLSASSEGRTDAMQLRLVKNKNGRTGTVELVFDRERVRVVNPEEGCFAARRFPISDTFETGTF